MKTLICFDLDGTLSPTSTWESFNALLGISTEDDQRLFTLYKEGKLNYKDWMSELVGLYKKHDPVSREVIEALANSIVLRPDAQMAIDTAKAKGYGILILSGSVDIIVRVIATRLGVADWRATNKAIFNEHNELNTIEDSGHERDAKMLLLQDFCTEKGYILPEVITVADGGNDTELFKINKGVLLGNNTELALLAWKHIQSLSELGDLL